MTGSTAYLGADPLIGSATAGRWPFGYDMPDELGGGFVAGELLLRSTASCCAATAPGATAPGRSPGTTDPGTR
jgi:hypothetical protein